MHMSASPLPFLTKCQVIAWQPSNHRKALSPLALILNADTRAEIKNIFWWKSSSRVCRVQAYRRKNAHVNTQELIYSNSAALSHWVWPALNQIKCIPIILTGARGAFFYNTPAAAFLGKLISPHRMREMRETPKGKCELKKNHSTCLGNFVTNFSSSSTI